MIGSLSCFLDFLTTPVFTLVCPILIFILYQKKSNKDVKQNIIDTIKCSIAWGIGYVLTWVTKWIVVDLLLNRNVFSSSINQVLFRINGDLNKFTTNYMAFFTYLMMYILSAILIIIVSKVIIRLSNNSVIESSEGQASMLKNNYDLLFICLIPLSWMIVSFNHILVHPHFTIKNIFAFLFIIIYFSIFQKEDNK